MRKLIGIVAALGTTALPLTLSGCGKQSKGGSQQDTAPGPDAVWRGTVVGVQLAQQTITSSGLTATTTVSTDNSQTWSTIYAGLQASEKTQADACLSGMNLDHSASAMTLKTTYKTGNNTIVYYSIPLVPGNGSTSTFAMFQSSVGGAPGTDPVCDTNDKH